VGRLVYSAITSLDLFVADEQGRFDWAAPDEEVHAFVNELERSVGIYLYGRRMYEVMHVWETWEPDGPVDAAYADIWRQADKVVYSTTLDEVRTPRTRIARTFDADEIRAMKADADISIGGATLAAEALRAGLVDEIGLFLNPVIIGGGTAALPTGLRIDLELIDEHRFGNGVVFHRYRCGR
jgi:dihydrofolate reductase